MVTEISNVGNNQSSQIIGLKQGLSKYNKEQEAEAVSADNNNSPECL